MLFTQPGMLFHGHRLDDSLSCLLTFSTSHQKFNTHMQLYRSPLPLVAKIFFVIVLLNVYHQCLE